MSECIETTYSRNKHGYGRCYQLRKGRRIYLAHVLAWVDAHDMLPPPEKPCILHTCDNPPCVNPEHLFAGTHEENMEDMRQKKRYRIVKAEWTHCPRNHEFTPENVVIVNGRRACRECRNAGKRRRWAEKRSERQGDVGGNRIGRFRPRE